MSEEERRDLCEELKLIENRLVEQLIRLYRQGADFGAFWEVVQRVYLFSQLRRNVCEQKLGTAVSS